MEGDKDDTNSDGSDNWFTDFFTWIKEGFSNIGQWFKDLGTSIGNWFNDLWINIQASFVDLSVSLYTWFSNIGTWFSELGTNIGNWFSDVGNWFSNLWTNICNFFTQKDTDEREESSTKSDDMSNTADEVNTMLDSKFGAFYTLGDFLKEFWNTIQTSGETKPEFKITLPTFLGGGEYSILDLSFYDNYRTYIHGIIAGVCYFLYIKRMYNKIPNIIHNS